MSFDALAVAAGVRNAMEPPELLHNGKIVLVTGGASGIGRAAALAFAREGACVAVADIGREKAQNTVSTIRARGGEAIFIYADMLEHGSIRRMIASTVAAFGGLDVAFNNVGNRGGGTNLVDVEEDEWDLVMSLNLKSIWLCMKYEIPELLRRGGGAIINTSSSLANFAAPNYATYTSSKAALVGLTRSAAVDFGPLGIRVNSLLPGATFTPMLQAARARLRRRLPIDRIPLRRVGFAEEQADAAVWLASHKASFVNAAHIVSDGGASAMR